MGFWDGVGRMMQGKPVFQDSSDTQRSADQTTQVPGVTTPTPPSNKTPVDSRGYKIIPEVRLERCKTRQNGNMIEVTAWTTNTSESEIELDKFVMMNLKHETDRRLSPRESREIRLFRGPIPTNDDAQKASLFYKLVSSGDYFRADYMVEYSRQQDGTYFVEEFHPERQIHDV